MADPQQDWFTANAPNSAPAPVQATGGDWFAANAPTEKGPVRRFLERAMHLPDDILEKPGSYLNPFSQEYWEKGKQERAVEKANPQVPRLTPDFVAQASKDFRSGNVAGGLGDIAGPAASLTQLATMGRTAAPQVEAPNVYEGPMPVEIPAGKPQAGGVINRAATAIANVDTPTGTSLIAPKVTAFQKMARVVANATQPAGPQELPVYGNVSNAEMRGPYEPYKGDLSVKPEATASGPVPAGEAPAAQPKTSTSVNTDLPRTNSGEGVLNQALTSLDNATLLKVAKSRGINVTKEAQLKAGAANGPLIKKIIDDFSPEELDDVRDKGIEASRNKPLPTDAATPEAGAEAWRSKVLQTFFPDVKVSAAMQTRVAKTLQQQLQARFEAARAAAESKANAVPVDDIQPAAAQGGHAGNGVTSVEEPNRPGINYVVSKSGQLTYQGKAFAPESTPNGSTHVTVLPDGSIRVNAGPQLSTSQTGALRFALKKQPWLTKTAKAGD